LQAPETRAKIGFFSPVRWQIFFFFDAGYHQKNNLKGQSTSGSSNGASNFRVFPGTSATPQKPRIPTRVGPLQARRARFEKRPRPGCGRKPPPNSASFRSRVMPPWRSQKRVAVAKTNPFSISVRPGSLDVDRCVSTKPGMTTKSAFALSQINSPTNIRQTAENHRNQHRART